MPTADVVVIGAGLAGLTSAIALADAGARVEVVARGHAATHWTAGGFDCGAPPGASTPADGIERLAARPGHPYAFLARDVRPGLEFIRGVLAAEGLDYRGELDDPLRAMPTSIGGTRRVAIVPIGQSAALEPWAVGDRLVVCGIQGYKDFWPDAIAASLARPGVWVGAAADDRPSRVHALSVAMPDQAGRHNVNALELGRAFDDPSWRQASFERIARAVDATGRQPGRIALPAVLGIDDHRAVLDAAAAILPLPAFEVPLVPPSLPGLRLYQALREALRRRGGRLSIGEPVIRVERQGKLVTAVVLSAAVRERRIATGAVVLATGGIAGGGLLGRPDGRIVEPLLDLPVEAPHVDDWLAHEPIPRDGHPLEAAGIRTDPNLRPIDPKGRVVLTNLVVAGSLLAGQRYLSERCGDGVAIASGRRAAATIGSGGPGTTSRTRQPAAALTAGRPS